MKLCPNLQGVPDGSDGKESPCNAGDPGLIPGLGRSPGEGNGNPLQYYCLANQDPLEKEVATHSSSLAWRIPMDTRAWWATVHVVAKSQTQFND